MTDKKKSDKTNENKLKSKLKDYLIKRLNARGFDEENLEDKSLEFLEAAIAVDDMKRENDGIEAKPHKSGGFTFKPVQKRNKKLKDDEDSDERENAEINEENILSEVRNRFAPDKELNKFKTNKGQSTILRDSVGRWV